MEQHIHFYLLMQIANQTTTSPLLCYVVYYYASCALTLLSYSFDDALVFSLSLEEKQHSEPTQKIEYSQIPSYKYNTATTKRKKKKKKLQTNNFSFFLILLCHRWIWKRWFPPAPAVAPTRKSPTSLTSTTETTIRTLRRRRSGSLATPSTTGGTATPSTSGTNRRKETRLFPQRT